MSYQRCLSRRLNRLCRATCRFQWNTVISIIVFASIYAYVVTRFTAILLAALSLHSVATSMEKGVKCGSAAAV